MCTKEKYTKRGLAFLRGDDASQDYEQAFYWLNAASQLGSGDADDALGKMYALGLGVPYDEKKGANYQAACADDINQALPIQDAITSNVSPFIEDANGINAPMNQTPKQSRCAVCGKEALAGSDRFQGAKRCVIERGGCGADLMLPILEDGLERGVALQPYRQYPASLNRSTYTSLGAFIHIIKYDERADEQLKIDIIEEIANRIAICDIVGQLVRKNAIPNLIVVPAPSSVRRKLQPVQLLAKDIALDRYGFAEPLRKMSWTESKNRAKGAELAPGEIRCDANLGGSPVLLIDDTYGEGATLRACIRVLKSCNAGSIYFLSVCKNVYGGMKGSDSDDDYIY